ncbi:MAG: hypothetical protein AABX50_02310 [Nanoarchaeota archaeon]
MALFERRKRKSERRIRIESDLASAIVILSYPNDNEDELKKRLKEVAERGYDIRHFISVARMEGGYAQGLNSLIARLENMGYTHDGRFRNFGSLTEKGMCLLEGMVLEAFSANPEKTDTLSKELNFSLNPLLQKYVREYLGMKEEQVYGRRFLPQSS